MPDLVVVKPGLAAMVQDLGRPGFGAYGIPEGGAMDRGALARANALVGNPPGAAALEYAYQPPLLRWDGAGGVWLALVGGEEMLLSLPRGHQVAGRTPNGGVHGYIAVAGGFDVPRVLGAQGTCLAGGFGGFLGRPLREGDRLPVAAHQRVQFRDWEPPPARVTGPLRAVTAGRRAAAEASRRFFETTWKVAGQDRVGVSLAGPRLRVPPIGMSEPLVPGAVQVTGDGAPILLLRDHPTVGGYPVVAVVAAADLDRAAELRLGATVRFERVSLAAAPALPS